jgi:hypothetical protein
MKTRPTREQIIAEADKLKAMKPNVLRSSHFGDDHHAAIDVQIDVLKGRIRQENIDDEQESGDMPDNVADAARGALAWMNGEETDSNETPSQEWESLLVK